MKKTLLLAGIAAFLLTACGESKSENKEPAITKSGLNPENFIADKDGKQTNLYTLTNQNGMEVTITNFGGRIVSVMVPDRQGTERDVVLAFDNIQDYMTQSSDFGATIGRYANRIGNAQFPLDGETIQLIANNGPHCLHGGPQGWQYKVFDAEQKNSSTLTLSLTSPDGDMNFPGTVSVEVTFKLTNDNAIDINYYATTDKKTVINMTNHSYFNLSGDPNNTTMDHVLYVNANQMTPIDETVGVTGEVVKVDGTPFDFRTPHAISEEIGKENEQIKFANGIDHNFVLNTAGNVNALAASLYCPETGIKLEVFTNEPGIQVYTGNFLNGRQTGKKGIAYKRRAATCLETQKFPNTPNHPEWPSAFLEPGQTYHSECIYKFSVE